MKQILSLQVWRLRMYTTEKVLGAAKPLLFLKEPLHLPEGQVKRVLWTAASECAASSSDGMTQKNVIGYPAFAPCSTNSFELI